MQPNRLEKMCPIFGFPKTNKISLLLVSLLIYKTAAIECFDPKTECIDNFEEYKAYLNRSYLHAHDEFRSRLAFARNRDVVQEHNKRFERGNSSYRLATNVMADMNNRSYMKKFLRLFHATRTEPVEFASEMVGSPLMQEIPDAIDWRRKGFITQPEHQVKCGSCYAFSIAKSMEGQFFKRTGKILRLSAQQIVDCSTSHGNHGCVGGALLYSLKYLQDAGGIMRDTDYKYVDKKGKCKFVSELAVVNVTSWAMLPAKDEKAIEKAVAHIGPVSVAINGSPESFQLYGKGIYEDDACVSTTVNHAMLVIGYGKDYWILKNWWGPNWGIDGYMRMRKGKNLCGIANNAAYAVI